MSISLDIVRLGHKGWIRISQRWETSDKSLNHTWFCPPLVRLHCTSCISLGFNFPLALHFDIVHWYDTSLGCLLWLALNIAHSCRLTLCFAPLRHDRLHPYYATTHFASWHNLCKALSHSWTFPSPHPVLNCTSHTWHSLHCILCGHYVKKNFQQLHSDIFELNHNLDQSYVG